jgi:DNA-binding IclR family transcriptional regulator
MTHDISFDSTKAGALAERLLETLNHGALCLMISVGHRTGLFDTMREMAPATSVEIAAQADLNERYVREWLGAMVTGRIVDVDPSTGRFSLPAGHAAFLSRSAGADNLAVFAQ